MDNENGTAVVVAAAAAVATTKGIALIFQQIFFFSFSFMRDFIFVAFTCWSHHSATPNPTTMEAEPKYNTFRLCLCTQSDKLRTGTFSPYVLTTTTRTAAYAKTMNAL